MKPSLKRPKSAAVGSKYKRLQQAAYDPEREPRYVHDPELFKSIKFDKSAVYFR